MRVEQPDWQRRRSDFNHQWLKNQFLSALDTAANLMTGRLRGADYLNDLLAVDLQEWPQRSRELNGLLSSFQSEMTPRKLFETPPLSDWEPETKEVVGELIHELWLVRYPVQDLAEKARMAAAEASKRYLELQECASGNKSATGFLSPEFRTRFEAFRTACRALAKAIERLPNSILVI